MLSTGGEGEEKSQKSRLFMQPESTKGTFANINVRSQKYCNPQPSVARMPMHGRQAKIQIQGEDLFICMETCSAGNRGQLNMAETYSWSRDVERDVK